MNITPNNPSIPIATAVNPQTDTLRRENQQREVIAKPAAASQSAAEKGVASDKERGRTPAQTNEQFDFAALRKQAETENSTISSEQEQQPGEEQQSGNEQKATNATVEGEEQTTAQEGVDETQQQEEAQAKLDSQKINDLQLRDREVRSHEQAHAAAGGPTTGAPSYSFEVGPDGKKYAVSGEVSVDLSPVKGDPRATITKMQKVYNAALAPANPSIQDTRVANNAAKLIAQAQAELLALQQEQPEGSQKSGVRVGPNDSFTENAIERNDAKADDFDLLINNTLAAQEEIAPSRSLEIDERAERIETFYSNINQAYEKPPRYQFELTA